MLLLLAKITFKVFGWNTICNIDTNRTPQAIIAAAPHTSNWDFIFALFGMRVMGIKMNFFIKDAFFFFPLDKIMTSLGGVAVDRSKSNSLVNSTIEKFKRGQINYLAVSAEGTRSYTENWKSGFYYISEGAKIPLYLGYIDYKKKLVGIDHEFKISGNFDSDLKMIQDFFKTITPKYPSKFNLHP